MALPTQETVLLAFIVDLQAEVRAHRDVLGTLAARHPELFGLATGELAQQLGDQIQEHRSRILIEMENKNPAFAAMLSSLGEKKDDPST